MPAPKARPSVYSSPTKVRESDTNEDWNANKVFFTSILGISIFFLTREFLKLSSSCLEMYKFDQALS